MTIQLRAQAKLNFLDKIGDKGSQYDQFKEKYWSDPGGFVTDCIQWDRVPARDGPAPYQMDAIASLLDRKRTSVRGPHGLGKTAVAAWAVLWFALTRDGEDWKALTTASAWRQLTKFLWPEIHKWARFLDWEKIGRRRFIDNKELLSRSIKLETGEALALASNNPAAIEGGHAQYLLYIFDEAKTIPPETWDAAEGAFSHGEAYWLSVSTPGEPNGRFYQIHKRQAGYEDWHTSHVTTEQAIAADMINPQWVEDRKRQWGEKSPVYQNRVKGQFAANSEDSVIPLSLIEEANERWLEWGEKGELDMVGVDVGRGGDKSVYASRYGDYIDTLYRSNEKDTMPVVGKTLALIRKEGDAIIDVIGIGAGVFDRLRELKRKRRFPGAVFSFHSSERTEMMDSSGELGFINKRSAGWWNLREMLYQGKIALPPDDKLIGDLTAPKWGVGSGGNIQVESKDTIKKRLGRSTDDGDAVVMAFWPVKAMSLPDKQPGKQSQWSDHDIGEGSRWKKY